MKVTLYQSTRSTLSFCTTGVILQCRLPYTRVLGVLCHLVYQDLYYNVGYLIPEYQEYSVILYTRSYITMQVTLYQSTRSTLSSCILGVILQGRLPYNRVLGVLCHLVYQELYINEGYLIPEYQEYSVILYTRSYITRQVRQHSCYCRNFQVGS